MARRTYIKGKWRDLHGTRDNYYYILNGKKVPFKVSEGAKRISKKIIG